MSLKLSLGRELDLISIVVLVQPLSSTLLLLMKPIVFTKVKDLLVTQLLMERPNVLVPVQSLL